MPEVFYGGPYLHESEAIEAALLHAHNEGKEVTKDDLLSIFDKSGISAGAVKLIDTHIDGVPHYEGERYWETIHAHGVPMLVKPHEDYVLPGDGGDGEGNLSESKVES